METWYYEVVSIDGDYAPTRDYGGKQTEIRADAI